MCERKKAIAVKYVWTKLRNSSGDNWQYSTKSKMHVVQDIYLGFWEAYL